MFNVKPHLIDIPGDDKIAVKTYNYYNYKGWSHEAIMGFVAENLVRSYYGIEPLYCDEPDDGGDIVVYGIKFDIKNTVDHNYAFDKYCNSTWRINAAKPLVADQYIFTKIDFGAQRCSIAGFLDHDTIVRLHCYDVGDILNYNGREFVNDKPAFIVPQTILHRTPNLI